MTDILVALVSFAIPAFFAFLGLWLQERNKHKKTVEKSVGLDEILSEVKDTNAAVGELGRRVDAFAKESRDDRAHLWRTLTEAGIGPGRD